MPMLKAIAFCAPCGFRCCPFDIAISSTPSFLLHQIDSFNLSAGAEELVLLDGGQTLDSSREVKRLSGVLTSPRFFYSSNNMMILNFLSTRTNATLSEIGSFQVTYEPGTLHSVWSLYQICKLR